MTHHTTHQCPIGICRTCNEPVTAFDETRTGQRDVCLACWAVEPETEEAEV